MKPTSSLSIELNKIEAGLILNIDAKIENTLFISHDALQNGEAEFQLREGCSYDYEFSKDGFSFKKDQIVQPHTRKKNVGIISPNIYVGTLSLQIFKNNHEVGIIQLEVQSVKVGYREDYRNMLEFITEKCTDLLFQSNSPVSHNFETDFNNDYNSLYQKFAFVKSIISNENFKESIHRIVTSPVTQWKETNEKKDIRNIKHFNYSHIKELISRSQRSSLPPNHFLQKYGLNSVPEKITSSQKCDSVDTPENRFIKYALENFLHFTIVIKEKSEKETRLWNESDLLEKQLESFLYHSIFKEISPPKSLKLNSPVLQRKEGYREVLQTWLMFDLAAKLIWKGGEDVYKGDKKDIAILYEYWLFFILLDLFKSIFNIKSSDLKDLITESRNGLNLNLKQGIHTPLEGVYDTGTRKLKIRFNYNRSFAGNRIYPDSGSWTVTMRPDYTLSFWPFGISESEAETEELIVHIHFDAKYKIDYLLDVLKNKNNVNLNDEKLENRMGLYKNADLLKMHAYKDAIRRTGGVYILYPGETPEIKKGFHEIIPGLGAFPVRPSKTETGIGDLKKFILEVINHFINRASQRETIAFRTYETYKDIPDEVHEPLPETYKENRDLIPGDTFVLVGFYRKEQYEWILKNSLYNARTGTGRGSIKLGPKEAGAKYILLHTDNETISSKLFKIKEIGPKIFSKDDLTKLGYPNPSQNFYLVYEIQETTEIEFINCKWDITKLKGYKSKRESSTPFSVSLLELMKSKVK